MVLRITLSPLFVIVFLTTAHILLLVAMRACPARRTQGRGHRARAVLLPSEALMILAEAVLMSSPVGLAFGRKLDDLPG